MTVSATRNVQVIKRSLQNSTVELKGRLQVWVFWARFHMVNNLGRTSAGGACAARLRQHPLSSLRSCVLLNALLRTPDNARFLPLNGVPNLKGDSPVCQLRLHPSLQNVRNDATAQSSVIGTEPGSISPRAEALGRHTSQLAHL